MLILWLNVNLMIISLLRQLSYALTAWSWAVVIFNGIVVPQQRLLVFLLFSGYPEGDDLAIRQVKDNNSLFESFFFFLYNPSVDRSEIYIS